MQKTTLDKINIDNIIDVMREPTKLNIVTFKYEDVYSVLEKNTTRKKIDKGDYKALLKILEVREFGRN